MAEPPAHTASDPHAPRRPRGRAHRVVVVGSVFSLLGPLLGVIVLGCTLLAVSVWNADIVLGEIVEFIPTVLALMVKCYPFGIVPALSTGIVIGLLPARLAGWRIALVGGIVGGSTTMLFLWALLQENMQARLLPYSIIGIIPGAVLAHALFRRDTALPDRGAAHASSSHPARQ